MKREEVLTRIDKEIAKRERFLKHRTEGLWSRTSISIWKEDLEFYKSIRSIIEGEKKGG